MIRTRACQRGRSRTPRTERRALDERPLPAFSRITVSLCLSWTSDSAVRLAFLARRSVVLDSVWHCVSPSFLHSIAPRAFGSTLGSSASDCFCFAEADSTPLSLTSLPTLIRASSDSHTHTHTHTPPIHPWRRSLFSPAQCGTHTSPLIQLIYSDCTLSHVHVALLA